MAEYKGSSGDGNRVQILERQREKTEKLFLTERERLRKDTENKLNNISSKFEKKTLSIEDELRQNTVGLVTLEQFAQKAKELKEQEEKRLKSEERKRKRDKQKKKMKMKHTLSFNMGEDEENDDESVMLQSKKKKVKSDTKDTKSIDKIEEKKNEKVGKKLAKNPDVDTSFLPDKQRQQMEELEREKIREQWLEEQEKIKEEEIEIVYSYWDGVGHRKSVIVKKGNTVADFLYKVQQDWKDLKKLSIDNLLYVKEDLIIPHHYSFYDFILIKARGKTGPLFEFEVRDDIRLLNDATKETSESHAGKVLDRRWFDKHKNEFPYNRWEVYDPKKNYGKYKIK